jgi:hypothetical protein
LCNIARRVDQLLLDPANMAAARALVDAYLEGRRQGTVEAIPFPLPPDEPDVARLAAALTPEQRAGALAALHEALCDGVEKVMRGGDLLAVLSWEAVLSQVRRLGDWAAHWFALQLQYFERSLHSPPGLPLGDLPPEQRRLILLLFRRGRPSVSDVARELYDRDDSSARGALDALLHRTREALERAGADWAVRRENNQLWLERISAE